MSKRLLSTLALTLTVLLSLRAQLPPKKIVGGHELYHFEDVINIPTLGVENQAQSGTCWSFGMTAVLESDIIKSRGKAENMSDMWVVRHAYFDKATKYIRLHGHLNLSVGGAMHDVVEIIKKYGIVPECVYPGLKYGESEHDFTEIDNVIKGYADAVIASGRPSQVWQRGLNALLDNYFGERIAGFSHEGEESVKYTPTAYAKSLGLDLDDYVSLISVSHHPYYKMTDIEVPDNWMWGKAYNLPIDELMQVMEASLAEGRTFGLGIDITEDGFKPFNGVATIPLTQEHREQRWDYIRLRREREFNDYNTTDDHCIQVVGVALNEKGERFYKAKNSWGEIEPYGGYIYLSKPYVELKTILIMVNSKVIPSDIKRRLKMK